MYTGLNLKITSKLYHQPFNSEKVKTYESAVEIIPRKEGLITLGNLFWLHNCYIFGMVSGKVTEILPYDEA